MNHYKSRKSQGRITINAEASEKLQALFYQQSDTSLVSSVADCSADEMREATTDHSTSSTSITDSNFNNTCVEVNSLPKIVITPPPASGNGGEKEGFVVSGAEEQYPPSIKLPLLSTSLLHPTERIRSASLRSTPASTNVKKPPFQPTFKPPLLKLDRISSASLRRKQPFIRSFPSPIEEEKEEEPTNKSAVTGDTSVLAVINNKEGSDRDLKSTVEQPSPSNNNTEQNQLESDSQATDEEVKGEVQCPILSTTYDVSSCIASGL